jgi:glyoxylase-like metal-dependent hydrolase (beta-lactamase superfamily II)
MSRRIYQVGNAEITRISEGVLTRIRPQTLIPQWSGEQQSVSLSVHAWLVREEGHSILIGTAAGNPPFLVDLRESGVTPEEIDLVLLSHLSSDNIGWNTRLENGRWIPTFPNAQYLFPQSEYALARADRMQPVIEAGLGKTLEVGLPVDGFSALPAPGHSPGHTAFVLRSDHRIALFCAGSLQHPIQVQNPDWNCASDAVPQAASDSRRRLLEFAAEHEAIVFTSHFTDSSVGRVYRTASGFLWRFM